MDEPAGLEGFDDDAIRSELLKMLDREEARLATKVSQDLSKEEATVEALGPEAQAVLQRISNEIRERGILVFNHMREYVQRSR